MKINFPFKHIRLLYLIFILLFHHLSGQNTSAYAVYENLSSKNISVSKSEIERLLNSQNADKKELGYYFQYELAESTNDFEVKKNSIAALKSLSETKNSDKIKFLDLITIDLKSNIADKNSFLSTIDSTIEKYERLKVDPFILNQLYKIRFDYLLKNHPKQIRRYDVKTANNYALLTKNNFLISESYNEFIKYYAAKLNETKQEAFNDSILISNQRADYYSELISHPELKTFSSTTALLNSISYSNGYRQSWDIDALLSNLQNAYNTTKHNKNWTELNSQLLLEMGRLFEDQKKYSEALTNYQTAYELLQSSEAKNNELQFTILDRLSKIQGLLSNANDSAFWQEKYNATLKEIIAQDKVQISETWQLLNTIEKSSESSLSPLVKRIIISTTVLLIVIALLFFLYTRKLKNRLNDTYFSFLREKQHNNILRLQLQSEENNFIQETSNKKSEPSPIIETDVKTNNKSSTIEHLETMFKESSTLNDIQKILKDETIPQTTSKPIEKKQFPSHPELYRQLSQISKGKLTHLDLKYASFIFMNLDNNEIAKIMNVESKTVRMTKYRLKQKLGLKKQDDLKDFILNLPTT